MMYIAFKQSDFSAYRQKDSSERKRGGTLMNSTKNAEIIVLVAIIITVVWGFLGGWDRSWIVMLVGVMVACIVRVIGRKDKT